MKCSYFFTLLLFMFGFSSCDSNSSESAASEATGSQESAQPSPVKHDYIRTDTIRFSADSNRWVLVGLQKGERQADSSWKHALDVICYDGLRQRTVYESNLLAQGEEDLVHNFYVCDTEESPNENFFTIIFGYPACGYLQQNWFFSVDTSGCHLITKFDTSSDSGYGNGLEFYRVCDKMPVRSLSSVAYSSEPDSIKENLIHMAFSDSVNYQFDGSKWTATSITPKDKVFRRATETW